MQIDRNEEITVHQLQTPSSSFLTFSCINDLINHFQEAKKKKFRQFRTGGFGQMTYKPESLSPPKRGSPFSPIIVKPLLKIKSFKSSKAAEVT